MKAIYVIVAWVLFLLPVQAQDAPAVPQVPAIDRNNLVIRQNSRDYAIVRRGNNHQRIMQIRAEVLIRQRQAIINRRIAMDRRRQLIQQRMIRQQKIRQRMIRQRANRNR